MEINVRLKLDPEDLIQAYCDSQGIAIANRNVKDILKDELSSCLDSMAIEVEDIQEVSS